MSGSVKWIGMTEFREALRNLPADLAEEAADIVNDAAVAATNEIYVAYPEKTGNLKRRLKVEHTRNRLSSTATVKSQSPHANIYEKGTASRRTRKGWDRGVMPPARSGTAMIPIVQKWRKRMVDGLIALVERSGFVVQK